MNPITAPSPQFPGELLAKIHHAGVIATLTIEDAKDALPLAQALSNGGVTCIELTLRTSAALDALRCIRAEMPGMMVGVGTILAVRQISDCLAAGASFGVAPGTNPRIIEKARCAGLPFAPGICTPSDIEYALQAGCSLMKFFPCVPCGGLSYLRSISAPFAHLGVKFIPLGGIDASNAASYLNDSSVPALGGSWIAPRNLVQEKNWAMITKNAQQATDIIKRVRGGHQ